MNLKILSLIFLLALITSCVPQDADNVQISDVGSHENIEADNTTGLQETQTVETSEDETTVENTTDETEDETTVENTTDETEDETTVENTTDDEITSTASEIIEIEDLKFKPDEMTINRGTTVKWIHNDRYSNSDAIKHIIRIYKVGDAAFTAPTVGIYLGESFSYTFTEPGEYYYIDIVFKESMRGTITVE